MFPKKTPRFLTFLLVQVMPRGVFLRVYSHKVESHYVEWSLGLGFGLKLGLGLGSGLGLGLGLGLGFGLGLGLG